jgi:hypothetical protein
MLYKVLPSLMDKEPEATVEIMLSKLPELQLNLVLPALLDFEDVAVAGRGSSDGRSSSSSSGDGKPMDTKSDKVHHSIRFLEEYINRAFEELRAPPADVLQALLWMLVRFDDPQEGKLVALLTKLCEMVAQDATDTAALFSSASGSCFDLEYVYRECHRRNRRKAAALLLAIKACKNRHQVDLERAVQAALAVDVEFGKIVCRLLCTIVLSGSLGKQNGSEKVKKSLWLQVANVLISGTERGSRSSVGTSGPSVNSNSSSSSGGGVVSSGPSVGVVGALKLLEDCGGVLQIEVMWHFVLLCRFFHALSVPASSFQPSIPGMLVCSVCPCILLPAVQTLTGCDPPPSPFNLVPISYHPTNMKICGKCCS